MVSNPNKNDYFIHLPKLIYLYHNLTFAFIFYKFDIFLDLNFIVGCILPRSNLKVYLILRSTINDIIKLIRTIFL